MDPHAIMAFLFNHAGVNIPQREVELYWRNSRAFGEEWAVNSEASDQHVPMGIYGDGAQVKTKFDAGENIIGVFIDLPLWRPRSVRASRFLVTAIPEEKLFGHHTMNVICERIAWSCNHLFAGRHPSAGPKGEALPSHMAQVAGTDICGGRAFAVTELRGDWSWHKKILRFRASWVWTSKLTCFQCPAQTVGPYEDAYYNIHSGNWREKEFTLAEFMAFRMPERGVCTLAIS